MAKTRSTAAERPARPVEAPASAPDGIVIEITLSRYQTGKIKTFSAIPVRYFQDFREHGAVRTTAVATDSPDLISACADTRGGFGDWTRRIAAAAPAGTLVNWYGVAGVFEPLSSLEYRP